jgi:hypothetical protein
MAKSRASRTPAPAPEPAAPKKPSAAVVQQTSAAYKNAEDAIAAAVAAVALLDKATDRALNAVKAGPQARRRHKARLARAAGALGDATIHVLDAHDEINTLRAMAGLPDVVMPFDGGGGK